MGEHQSDARWLGYASIPAFAAVLEFQQRPSLPALKGFDSRMVWEVAEQFSLDAQALSLGMEGVELRLAN